MMQHLYSRFLSDFRGYELSEKFWQDLWKDLVKAADLTEWKSPWLGAPLRDGKPMLSAVSSSLGRAVHVIQHAPTSEQLELVWWLDKFGEQGDERIIDQLVIACALSREAASQARSLVRSWATRGQIESTSKKGGG
jgi:hypothetical protein